MGSFFVFSCTYQGIEPQLVRVETDIARGLPQFTIVGLPDAAVTEARARVRAAIKNSGFTFPSTRITVNLSPADVKKFGATYDVPIALSVLAASGQIDAEKIADMIFMGALGLDGTLQPIKGALLGSALVKKRELRAICVPKENVQEALCVDKVLCYSARNLTELVTALQQKTQRPEVRITQPICMPHSFSFDEIYGQQQAKRALTIAAAGRHHALMCGPPGSGKTTLAKAFSSLLPPLGPEESLPLTKLYSVAGLLPPGQTITRRPFRAPHHTSSCVALIGGGTNPQPGEVSLAHNGVLFLDEFPEFPRTVLETLRQPLENGSVSIARAKYRLTYPSRALLLAAMNPCPCGYATDHAIPCTCLPSQQTRYQQKLSGPLMDRIDLFIDVPRLDIQELSLNKKRPGDKQQQHLRQQVQQASERQRARYKHLDTKHNGQLSVKDLRRTANPTTEAIHLLDHATTTWHLSTRAYFKVLKIARTIADLEKKDRIEKHHMSEALQYRKRREKFNDTQ